MVFVRMRQNYRIKLGFGVLEIAYVWQQPSEAKPALFRKHHTGIDNDRVPSAFQHQ